MEKARGSEALSLFGSVAGAEQRYYLTKDHYTTLFKELDLDLSDSNGNLVNGDTQSSFTTKNFEIKLDGNNKDAYIHAKRIKGRYIYELCKNHNDGHMECGGTQGGSICPTLGDFDDKSPNAVTCAGKVS